MSFPEVLQHLQALGYKVFTEGDLNLNLIGIRSPERKAGVFDDEIRCVYKDNDAWVERRWPATTDPGLYYLKNPENIEGAAILVPGQYPGLWRIGKHRGQYEALVQAKPCTVWRDGDRDDLLDPQGAVSRGIFGINLHSTKPGRNRNDIEKFSAGCQVLRNWADLQELMVLVNKAALRWGNGFTYTLIGGPLPKA